MRLFSTALVALVLALSVSALAHDDTRRFSPVLASASGQAAKTARTPFSLNPGAGFLGRSDPGAFGGEVELSASYRINDVFEPEILVGTGVVLGEQSDYTQRFSFGLRVIAPLEVVEPFLWVGFSHFHEVAGARALKAPIAALLSLSDAGTIHRSGGEIGLGLIVPLASELGRPGHQVKLILRGGAMFLPGFAGGGADHLYSFGSVALSLPIDFDRLSANDEARAPSTTTPASS